MERSKDVLAVMGLLCVNRQFRGKFFADPRTAAQTFVGKLTPSELKQIDDLGGRGRLPSGFDRDRFIGEAKDTFDVVSAFYLCPKRPCPVAGSAAAPPRRSRHG